jgi:predicted ATPase/DNA-binding XRE family transcriptional regulator
MESLTEHIGERLRRLRSSRRLTQEELAERFPGGLSVDTISNIERGRVRPRRQTLIGLLSALDVDKDEQESFLLARPPRLAARPEGDRSSALQSLPVPLTPLIGRSSELTELQSLLAQDDVRLITLTGPGGVGKTRLALAAAEAAGSAFRDGVTFVDLTSLRDPSELLDALAFPLGLANFGDRTVADRLTAHLRGKNMLLLLDNCETALEAAPLLAPVLQTCRGIRMLATSRAALHPRGEQEFPVLPLPLPTGQPELLNAAALAGVPSVAFFLHCSRMVSPNLTLTHLNAASIAQICSRLDGLPLALELAAARMRHLTPEMLAARLTHTLSELVQGARDLPERQRTLRATLDWSHGMLTAMEQRVFRRLAVFADGCNESAALLVCRNRDEDDAAVRETLEALLDKNLLTVAKASPEAGEPRFAMLQTIREYAGERLRDSGEERVIRNRHADFFCSLAEASFPQFYSPNRGLWIKLLRADHGNLVASLSWCLEEGGPPDLGLRLAGALGRYWYFIGNLNDGRAWLAKALALPRQGAASSARARALYSAGKLAWVQGDHLVALAHAEACLAEHAASEDELARAEALTLHGYALVAVGNASEGLRAYRESIEIERGLGATWSLALSLAMSSEAERLMGDPEAAANALDEALDLFRGLSDSYGQAITHGMMAGLHFSLDDITSVYADLEQAEIFFRELPEERYTEICVRFMRGFLSLQDKQLPQARESLTRVLHVSQELGQTAYILLGLAGAATLAALTGQVREAVMLFSKASPLLGDGALHVDDGAAAARASFAQIEPLLRSHLEKDFDAVWASGQGISLEAAIELAHALLTGSHQQAARSGEALGPTVSLDAARPGAS